MKLFHLLPLLSLRAAYVIPSEEVLEDLSLQKEGQQQIKETVHDANNFIQNTLDDTIDSLKDLVDSDSDAQDGFDAESWFDHIKDYALNNPDDNDNDNHEEKAKYEEDIINQKLPFPLPHLPPPHHRPSHSNNKTIYQLLSTSKYTTTLTKIINEDESLVHLLNRTTKNDSDDGKITIFAPTDRAFAKLPPHLPHPSKEFIRAVLRYHIAPGVYTALTAFHRKTLPTLLNESASGVELPQRLTIRAGLRGLKVDFYSRLIAVDITASNGLIHGIDSILLPPPSSLSLFNLVPTQFSTLTLGLLKTGLAASLEDAQKRVTIFAPSNKAFQNLGLRINAFLFSSHGVKYLRALLQYHIVENQTLYSDTFYTPDGQVRDLGTRGFTHLDLPTLLKVECGDDHDHGDGDKKQKKKGPSLAVDVARFGAFGSIKLNGFRRVAFADALARDGAVHILDHVLIPPRKVKGHYLAGSREGEDEAKLTIEDLKDRLSDWVEEDDTVDNDWDHDGEL